MDYHIWSLQKTYTVGIITTLSYRGESWGTEKWQFFEYHTPGKLECELNQSVFGAYGK